MNAFSRKFCSLKVLTAEHLTGFLKKTQSFEHCLKNLKVISLEKGKCLAEFDIKEEHTNPMKTLHGGLIATLVDVVSSYGLSSLEKGNVAHVSVNMNIRYINSAPVGTKIVIESETAKCGRTLAFLEVTIKDKDSGSLLAKGEQTKYLLNAPNSIMKY